MKLMTKALEKRFAQIGEQIHSNDPIVVCKFFYPCGSRTWYVTEYYPRDGVCYGYVVGPYPEWGYFALSELENMRGDFGLGIERDLYFSESLFSSIKNP